MSGNRRGNNVDPGTMGCLVFALIGIVAMPIVGIYLIAKKTEMMEPKCLAGFYW